MNKIRLRFQAGKLEAGLFKYVGYTIEQKENITLDQEDYISKILVPKVTAGRAKNRTADLTSKEHT